MDIDSAFESFVALERTAYKGVKRECEEAGEAIGEVATAGNNTPLITAYSTALAAREDLIRAVAPWVQYAVDANVLTAVSERVGCLMDALEGLLNAYASSGARGEVAADAILKPCTQLTHMLAFFQAAAGEGGNDLVKA